MTSSFDHNTFLSPFTWRYGAPEMRALWSEVHKRRLWRQLWVALAHAEQIAGLVSAEQVADLQAHADDIDIEAAEVLEAKLHHDLMAEVQAYAAQCPIGGGIIHLGATSADIEDNADVLRIRDSIDLIIGKLTTLLQTFADQILRHRDAVVMAFTHIQPAEPTTLGYRLALYAQDLLDDLETLTDTRSRLRAKGFKGAVGTSASYGELLAGTGVTLHAFEAQILAPFNLETYGIASQTYPRKQDWQVVSALAGVAGSLYKFAFDLRILQSPAIGEWGEPFGKSQIGSSAMPFKRNPINAEKMNSLGRLVESLVGVAWNNAAHSLLERTLDDSANRRELLPVAFLAVDEMLIVAQRIIDGLRIDESAAARNLARFGVFAAVERVLMAAAKAGADRQEIHEHLREHSLTAWAALSAGQPNPLIDNLAASPILARYLAPDTIRALLDASSYVGDAPDRAQWLAERIQSTLSLNEG
ncbi:MAG: adenylosuccinate lyase [Chloroflexota bacterium]|nr:adenylosuccinate lyase [Chloroflexota bacterium]